jgi:hypothetical protein
LSEVSFYEEWSRLRALKAICRHIRKGLIRPSLAAVDGFTNSTAKRELLVLLAGLLDGESISAALEVCGRISDEEQRTCAMKALAAKTIVTYQAEILRAIDGLSSAGNRARALASLLGPDSIAPEILARVRREMLYHLRHAPFTCRLDIFEFLSHSEVFREPVLDQNTLTLIANDCADICGVDTNQPGIPLSRTTWDLPK